jgi:type I restriction enzyme S subunit
MREMKDSGIEWVGQIPFSWDVKPIRAKFREVTEKNKLGIEKNALKFTYGNIVKKDNFDAADDDYVANTILNYMVVNPGTIMLNGLNLNFDFVTQRVALVKERGIITSAYIAFAPILDDDISTQFFTYLLKAYDSCKAFHNMGGGVRKILNFAELKKQYIVYPTITEQKRIANFLDAKCAEIDALTADIQTQIDTLEQYMRSVITETVTKGLNPDVEMKDSGIEEVGKIPGTWIKTRFKYVAEIKSNLVSPEGYEEYPQISPDNIEKNAGKLLAYNSVEEAGIISGNHLFYKGQILYSKIRPNLNKVIIAPFDGLCSADMYPIESNQMTKFILYMMLSDYFVEQVSIVIHDRVKMPKINQDELGEIRVVIPIPKDQMDIVRYLDEKCSEIDAIIIEKKEQLTTLNEYKKSLIYEYVTGKKEVPAI